MPWWSEMPWRMIQTNLAEPDFLGLDPTRYAESCADLGATVVLLNAAGISAGYASSHLFHTFNPYLVDASLLIQLVEALHKRGLKALARVDFSKVPLAVGQDHPSWLYRTKDGKLMVFNGYATTCICGEYQQTVMLDVLHELFSTIAFDGLYCNMTGFQTRDYSHTEHGFCHCDACRKAFGEEMPSLSDLSDARYHRYLSFQERVVTEQRNKIQTLLSGFPDRELCFDGFAFDRREAASTLNRSPIDFLYHASSNCRLKRKGAILSNADVDFPDYSQRHVSVSPSLHRLRLYQTLAWGGSLDYYVVGRLENRLDRSGLAAVKEVFSLHKRWHAHLDGLETVGSVLLRRSHPWTLGGEEEGWITILTEAHIPFCETDAKMLASLDLSSYSLVILPDSWNLKKEEALALDQYVEQGGKLIATARSGLYDAVDGRRSEPLVKSLGIRQAAAVSQTCSSALLLARDEEKQRFFPRLREADVLPVGEAFIPCVPKPDTQVYLPLIPDHPYGPPECCFFEQTSLVDHGLYRSCSGKGETLFLPWYPGSCFQTSGSESLRLALADLVCRWAGVASIAPNAPPAVEISLTKTQTGRLVVQLVNTSGTHGQHHAPCLPMRAVEVVIAYPELPRSVVSLQDSWVAFSWEAGTLTLFLSELGAYDALFIDSAIPYEEETV